ncbi:unnamed protein product [Sordaria macrospora k-hell]|uniref:WGS project CABT00000000 data, contig 2.32 n=1 Tax=Sordaria macrospora (strain ATCC MYA-333 / DSM 997 / K(L3346) / K-hell) TaxID=771870 RepID=F7W5Z8_SORMK|nr:uncharacterized protein SMAC_06078 [Sordaria macrospora k-hell]CCC12936.1 unnamed protein product [Sordaria macrospora k-hell]
MHLPSALWLTAALSTPVSALNLPQWGQKAIDTGVALQGLNTLASKIAYQRLNGKCNKNNVRVRKEWRNLSKSERRDYLKAFKCILDTPSSLPAGEVPGALSAYDDFIYLHLNVTPIIHNTGTFLPWHRYYIHGFERALQKCGYKGPFAYWNHGLDVDNLLASPIFDGSDTSLGGNGDPLPHGDSGFIFPGFTEVNIIPAGPNGRGGGCVTKGPPGIAGMQTHLGPVALPKYGEPGNLTTAENPLADNKRCFTRDLSEGLGRKFATFRNTTDLILKSKNIFEFSSLLQGDPRYHPRHAGEFTSPDITCSVVIPGAMGSPDPVTRPSGFITRSSIASGGSGRTWTLGTGRASGAHTRTSICPQARTSRRTRQLPSAQQCLMCK